MTVPYVFANRRDTIQLAELDANFAAVSGGGGGPTTWGSITGTLGSQTDLQTALNLKADASAVPAQFAPIAGTNITLTGTYPNITFNAAGGGGSSTWGSITGTLSSQTDLQTALNLKADASSLSTHESDTTTHGTTGAIVGTTDTQTLTNKSIGSTGLQMDIVSAAPAWAEGKVFYDTTDHTLAYYNDTSGVTVNIGQENVIRVRNTTGATITEGQLVYINGATGNRPTVALAQANTQATSGGTIGMTTQNLANNTDGYVTTFGIVHGLNTNAYTEGTELFLSSTVAGGWTSTRPVAPSHGVSIGFVTRQHVTQGTVIVKIADGLNLSELHDVKITSVASNNLLRWNTAGYWENIAGPAGAVVGTTDTQILTNKSISGSTNTLTNIPQSALAANVAGNGPAFSVFRTGSVQNITASTYTKVQLNGERFDTATAFDSTTNFRFQPTVAGYYQCDACVVSTSVSNNVTQLITSLYVNGAEYYWSEISTPAVTRSSCNVSGLIYLNGTSDFVELFGFCNGTAPFIDVTRTYMAGFLARAA